METNDENSLMSLPRFGMVDTETCYSCLILANGAYPTHPIPLHALQQASTLLCCDRAGLTAIAHGLKPKAIVGDGDSIPKEFLQEYGNLFHIIPEQEYNDLTKTTRYLMEHYTPENGEVCYVGATGKREDHTLGNLSLLVYYSREMGLKPVMLTDYGWFVVAKGKARFDTFKGQQVSIFNIDCQRMESQGLKWQSYPYRELWQGTLNEATGDIMVMDADSWYVIFRTYPA